MRRFIPLLLLLWAFAYLPNLAARDLRLEEGRRATPALEMLRTHDFLTPRLYGETYLSKPPLYFWLVAGTEKLLGGGGAGGADSSATRWLWAVRLPSALGALLGALALLAFARRSLDPHLRCLIALAWLATITLLDKGTLGELDALLSSLVLVTFALFFDGFDHNPRQQPSLRNWSLAGLVMAVAVLLKGPGGPLEFYCLIIPFLIWNNGLKRAALILLSPGHILFMLLSALPTLAWVLALLHYDNLSFLDLLHIWGKQTGLDEVGLMHTGTPGDSFAWSRYLTFPLEVFTMCLPWSLWAIPAAFPPVGRWAGLLPNPFRNERAISSDTPTLYRFLASGILGITAVFYLYPGAQARHMMAVAFPMCSLAILFMTSPTVAQKLRGHLGTVRSAAFILAALPVVIGLTTLVLSIVLTKGHPFIPLTISMAVAAAIVTILGMQSVRVVPRESSAAGLVLALSLLVLTGFTTVSGLFVRIKAPTDVTAIAHHQIDQLPSDAPTYTTRAFSTLAGNGYYNIQFYADLRAAGGLLALPDPQKFPPIPTGAAGAVVICTPEEIPLFQRLTGELPEELATIGVSGRSPDPLVAVRLRARP